MVDIKALSVKHPVRGLLGLLLSVYSRNLEKNTPLSDLAWLNSALLHSSILKKKDESLTLLKQRVESFKSDDSCNFTVQQALGLIIGLKVLLDLKLVKTEKISSFKGYFDKLSKAEWFRVREVAALFCFSFKSQPGFEDLTSDAEEYLKKEFRKNYSPIGVTLFGLSQNGQVEDYIDPSVEAAIKKILSTKRQNIEELSYLCLALKDSKSPLEQEALDMFQDCLYDRLYEVTLENSEVISLLLVILYLSNSETNGERILEKLKSSNIKEETKKRVQEIIKSNDNLLINFKDSSPVDPPIFKSMSVALYALSQIPLSNVFLFHPTLRENVESFLQATQDKTFKVISKKNLILLVLVFDAVVVFLGFNYWWSFFDYVFKSIEPMQPGIIKNAVNVISWIAFVLPFYMVINFNIGILKKGWLKSEELFVPFTLQTFLNKAKVLLKK